MWKLGVAAISAQLLTCALLAVVPTHAWAAGTTNGGIVTIPVGGEASNVAIAPDGQFAYLTADTNMVKVVNLVSHTLRSIHVGSHNITDIAISPNGKVAIATSDCSEPPCNRTVEVISTSTQTIVTTVNVGSGASLVAFSPNEDSAFVIAGRKLFVIDAATNHVVSRIPITAGTFPSHIAVSNDGRYAYISTTAGDTFEGSGQAPPSDQRIDIVDLGLNRQVASLDQGTDSPGPCSLAINPEGTDLYEAFCSSLKGASPSTLALKVISTSSHAVTATIPFRYGESGIAFSPSGKYAYVGDEESAEVAVINTSENAVVGYIAGPRISTPLGQVTPEPTAVGNDGHVLYTNDFSFLSASGHLSIIPIKAPYAKTASPPPSSIGDYHSPLADELQVALAFHDAMKTGWVHETYSKVGSGGSLQQDDEVGTNAGSATISEPGIHAEVVVSGESVFIRGTKLALHQYFHLSSHVSNQLADKWVVVPSYTPLYRTASAHMTLKADFSRFTFKVKFKGARTVIVNGQKCLQVTLRQTTSSGPLSQITIDITRGPGPLPVKLVRGDGGEMETWTWSAWGKAAPISVPKGSAPLSP